MLLVRFNIILKKKKTKIFRIVFSILYELSQPKILVLKKK